MLTHRMSVAAIGLAGLFLTGAGCGGDNSRPAVYPVSGTVAYNGQPVEGAVVRFMSDESSRAATGITDAEGKFQLSTYSLNDGAIAGVHKVTVTKADPAAEAGGGGGGTDEQALEDAAGMASMFEMAEEAEETKSLLPSVYSSMTTTPLTETVSDSGDNVFVIQLAD